MTGPEDNDAAHEAVRLRANPPPVARLSRPVIISLAGGGAVAIGAVLALALQPKVAKPIEPSTDASESRLPLSAVANAPKSYGEVPRLGPPLPGDLGRPIVAARGRGTDVTPPPIGAPAAAPPNPELEARRQAQTAARASALFMASARGAVPATPPTLSSPVPPAPVTPTATPTPPSDTRSAKQAFVTGAGAPQTLSGFRPVPPAGRKLLQAQTVIPAALLTAVNSDLPGPIAAQVTRNVYDSLTGRTVLIPQGAKLLGTYDAQVAFGQRRVLLVWERVIFPDGRSLQLDRLIGADAAGRSGLTDKVDAHWSAMGKAALLSSLLGVGSELGSDDDGELTRALRQGVQDTVNQTGQQVVRRQLDVQPTLTLRAGLALSVLVTRDIVFDADQGPD